MRNSGLTAHQKPSANSKPPSPAREWVEPKTIKFTRATTVLASQHARLQWTVCLTHLLDLDEKRKTSRMLAAMLRARPTAERMSEAVGSG